MSSSSKIPIPAWLVALERRLVVSCQSLPDSPMDRTDIIVAMARAAVDGGAAALRIEGVTNVRAVAAVVTVPVIGIVKRDLDDSPVRITPYVQDALDLIAAGAKVVAVDATDRVRPASVTTLLQAIQAAGAVAMADCSTEADGLRAWASGFALIGTTLSGYTAETAAATGAAPDFDLVERLARAGCRVVAEGRLRSPEHAAEALRRGAFSVTIGSAITRIEHITEWFTAAMAEAGNGARS